MVSFHCYLVSDSTGETVLAVARASVAQFSGVESEEHIWTLVRDESKIDEILEAVARNPGVVICTLVNRDIRDRLVRGCQRLGVPCIPVLDSVLSTLSGFLDLPVRGQPGGQHALDAGYFARVDAIQFVLRHDDGQLPQDLDEADIVVVGVSRTSKTPTCFYLANRGLKAANVPIVPGVSPPDELLRSSRPLIVALTQSAERLIQIRRNRMIMLKQEGDSNYTEPASVRQELTRARRLYESHKWPVIDVTRRSIEETAATILQLYQKRFGSIP